MEQAIVDAIAQMRFPAATVAAKWITSFGEWWVLLAAVTAGCFVLLFQKRIQAALCFGTGYMVLLLAVYALKEFVQRPRPLGGIIEDSLFSFPSAHSALSTYVFCAAAFLFAPRVKNPTVRKAMFIILFGAPLLVALTRLYLGAHFLTDVLAGILFGGVAAFSVINASNEGSERKNIEVFYTKYWQLYLAMITVSDHRRSLRRFFETRDILRSEMKIVDVGCGAGALTQELWQISKEGSLGGIRFFGFDLTPAMLSAFRRWIERHEVKNVSLTQANVLHLSSADEFIDADLVVSSGMLEYLPKGKLTDGLIALHHILKPNGRVVIFISRRGWFNRLLIGWLWRANLYSESELLSTFKQADFSEISIRPFKSWGYVVEGVKNS